MEPCPVAKKQRKDDDNLSLYLSHLPNSPFYERSFMHRDIVTHVVSTPSQFVLTGSCDGVLKFWRKTKGIIEFVKTFKAHGDRVCSLAIDDEGKLLVSVSGKDAKVFDIINFDMIQKLVLERNCTSVAWCKGKTTNSWLAFGTEEGTISIISMEGEKKAEINLHSCPVVILKHHPCLSIMLSMDTKGHLEMFSTDEESMGKFPKDKMQFHLKSSTDLYAVAKAKAIPLALSLSPDGSKIAILSTDRQIRVFQFASGKLLRQYDESLKTVERNQVGRDSEPGPSIPSLELLDNDKNVYEKYVTEQLIADSRYEESLCFDESSTLLLYPSYCGIKVVSLLNNKLVRIIGKSEDLRILSFCLLEQEESKMLDISMATSGNPLLQPTENSPMIVATALNRDRLFVFTDTEPCMTEGVPNCERDIINEKPDKEEKEAVAAKPVKVTPLKNLASTAVIHTEFGDIFLDLFPSLAPLTVENFSIHAKQGYYNGLVFHRIVKSFMIQGGDPLGDGTGGESIWGKTFQDEITNTPETNFKKPYRLAMANAGPNTNGSQFFITTVPCQWLDGKHTVFGSVSRGSEVVHKIEHQKVRNKLHQPLQDIRIISVDCEN